VPSCPNRTSVCQIQDGGDRDSSRDDTIDAGDGDDLLWAKKNTNFTLTDTSLTGLGSDTISGITRAFIKGGGSANTLDASAFSLGPVTLLGRGGDDTMLGTNAADSLDGGPGNDSLVASGGEDTLRGRDGNDLLDAGDDDDLLSGEMGDDTLLGGAGADTIEADDGDNSVAAGSGDDLITAGMGNDTVDAQDGDDTITAGGGDDVVDGGSGYDTLIESGIAGDVTITDVAVLGVDSDTIAAIEKIDLAGDDSAHFFDARDYSGDVVLRGGDGDDTLAGGSGNDQIVGQDGNDHLDGQGGSDTLAGGSGAGADAGDVLVGAANEIDEAFTLDFDSLIDQT